MISPRLSFILSSAVFLATLTTTLASPTKLSFHGQPMPALLRKRQSLSEADLLENGKAAQQLNKIFVSGAFKEGDQCEEGTSVCIGTSIAECSDGKYTTTVSCPDDGPGMTCYATPLFTEIGTSTACDTRANTIARIERTGATGSVRGEDTLEVEEPCEEGEDDCVCTEADDEEVSTSASSSAPANAAETPAGSPYRRARSFGRRENPDVLGISEVPVPVATATPTPDTDSTASPSATDSVSDPLPTEEVTSSSSEPPAAPNPTENAGDENPPVSESSSAIDSEITDTEAVEATGSVVTVVITTTETIFTVPPPAPTAVESKSESEGDASSSTESVPLPGRTGIPEDEESASNSDPEEVSSSPSPTEVVTETGAPSASATESAAPGESEVVETDSDSSSSSSEADDGTFRPFPTDF